MNPVERELVSAFLDRHPADAARELEAMVAPEVAEILASVAPGTAARALAELVPPRICHCLESLDPVVVGPILERLPIPTATAALATFEAPDREKFLREVAESVARTLRAFLTFPTGTIGRLIEPATNTVRTGADPDSVRRVFASSGMPYVYVVDEHGRLAGVISQRGFDRNPSRALDSSSGRAVSLDSLMTVDAVRNHSAWLGLDSLPVVDVEGRLLGVLRHKRVRQNATRSRPPAPLAGSAIDALVGLGEAYCLGLWEVIGPTTLQAETSDTDGSERGS